MGSENHVPMLGRTNRQDATVKPLTLTHKSERQRIRERREKRVIEPKNG